MAHHNVDIHIQTFTDPNGRSDNRVAVVSPSSFEFMDGDTVTFTSVSAEDIQVWFPKVWYEPPSNLDLPATTRVFDVPKKGSGAELVLKVDGKLIPKTDKYVPYQVYCGTINEFAVGDSPPKMKLEP
ncbi:hypothetical protein DRQ50_02725 [bacterium]|nr:MAG: hypothetical protein DRQ50_02725 [bacterium]